MSQARGVGSRHPRVFFWRPWFPPHTYPHVMRGLFTRDMAAAAADVERGLQTYLGARHVILMPSGTMAIQAALQVLLPPGKGKVLLPSLICDTVPHAVLAAGREPCFVESDPDTYSIDIRSVEERADAGTQAIIAVHQFGLVCPLDRLTRLARERGVLLIEDAAQALGADYRGRKAGTLGDVGILSFNNKVIDACGGGAVVTEREDHCELLRGHRDRHFPIIRWGSWRLLLRAWLASEHPGLVSAIPRGVHASTAPSLNRQIDLITPLLLQKLLPVLDSIVLRRWENFNLYDRHLTSASLGRPVLAEGSRPAGTFYTVRFAGGEKQRDMVREKLRQEGIQTEVVADSAHRRFAPATDLPVSDSVARTSLSFPTDPHVGEKEIQYIGEVIKGVVP